MQNLLWLLLGCAAGGMARYALTAFVDSKRTDNFPWGTLYVNVSGALAIGVLAAVIASGNGWLSHIDFSLFLLTGFLGSYTTVSSFSLQTFALINEGETRQAVRNVVLSFFLCLSGAALGLILGTLIAGPAMQAAAGL